MPETTAPIDQTWIGLQEDLFWRLIKIEPGASRFVTNEYDHRTMRAMVAVEGVEEPGKATCHLYPERGNRRSWVMDGMSGDWKITAWMPLPALPPGHQFRISS